MKTIKRMKTDLREEIKDAEKYIRAALEYREESPEMAEMYKTLAEEELKHMEILHGMVVKQIEKWKKETGKDPPPDMMARYEVMHQIAVEDANDVRRLMQIYKEAKT